MDPLQLSLTLRADGFRSPQLAAWLSKHGSIPGVVLAQLAESGLRAGNISRHSPSDARWPATVDPVHEEPSWSLRLRLALHPLAHPLLIAKLKVTPPELHRRLLLNAIEAGVQFALAPDARSFTEPITASPHVSEGAASLNERIEVQPSPTPSFAPVPEADAPPASTPNSTLTSIAAAAETGTRASPAQSDSPNLVPSTSARLLDISSLSTLLLSYD